MSQSREWNDMIRTWLNVATKYLWTLFECNHEFVFGADKSWRTPNNFFPSKKIPSVEIKALILNIGLENQEF